MLVSLDSLILLCVTRDKTNPVAILQVSARGLTGRTETSDFSGSLMRGERLRSHQSHAAQPAVVPPKNNLSHNRLLSKGLPTKGGEPCAQAGF